MSLKYVLYKPGNHGMGNKLLVLSTAMAICKATKSKLIVDWKSVAENKDIFWEFFSLNSFQAYLSDSQNPAILNGMRSSQSAWEGRFEADLHTVYRDVTKSGQYMNIDNQDIPPISGLLTYFKGQPQKDVLVLAGYSSVGQQPAMLLRHLRFSPWVETQLEIDLRKVIGTFRKSDLVGLHVRAASPIFPKPQYDLILKHLRSNPSSRLIIATDSQKEQDWLASILKERLICAPKFFPTKPNLDRFSDEPLALHRIEFDNATGKTMEGCSQSDILYQAIMDWLIISCCSRIYFQPESTFSLLMLLFSRTPPWRVRPHCKSSLKAKLQGFVYASYKYRTKPRLIPNIFKP